MSALSAVPSLAPRALYEEVAELIRQRIFSRELEPGSWIDELQIAKAYGISRTPLREALKVLAAEGLVTMKVRRGAYVTEVSEKDLRDVYHLLSLLESDAAAVVAQTASPADLKKLQSLHAELEAAGKPGKEKHDKFFEVNEAFHMCLLELAQNKWRDQMVADLRKVMKLNRHNSLFKTGRITESLAEHQAIMAALNAKDPVATAARMREHFANGLMAASASPA
ncbi:MAG: GntR family transcriptional regulator [Betaproteobacteria bacterium]|jgi:DNA-binding GntR family transcriptional regulator|nr:GntR family transcriptional regulator [Betaproteobacteria bacterium]NBZ98676.1 GntR family transcriptional regulator [Betaproteobacteria bacterium]NDB45165.1 GntR family transcriptional regulator [Betaproteobacteria bacterium]NDD01240.1 GntR family transcriptional regulator [Betaproteobacteria bacterium]NDF78137.1 GntR family transcriptional regulator [Betaproteobacteria bacterium]